MFIQTFLKQSDSFSYKNFDPFPLLGMLHKKYPTSTKKLFVCCIFVFRRDVFKEENCVEPKLKWWFAYIQTLKEPRLILFVWTCEIHSFVCLLHLLFTIAQDFKPYSVSIGIVSEEEIKEIWHAICLLVNVPFRLVLLLNVMLVQGTAKTWRLFSFLPLQLLLQVTHMTKPGLYLLKFCLLWFLFSSQVTWISLTGYCEWCGVTSFIPNKPSSQDSNLQV